MISCSWPLFPACHAPLSTIIILSTRQPHTYTPTSTYLYPRVRRACAAEAGPRWCLSVSLATHTHAHTADVTSSRWRGTHSSVTAGPGTATQILRGECTIGSIRLCLTSRVRPFGQRHVVVYAMQSNRPSICSRASCQYLGGFISTHGCNLCLAYPVSSIISSSPLFLHDQSDVRSCIDRPVWCIKSLFDRIEDIIGPIISQCHATCFMFYFRQ